MTFSRLSLRALCTQTSRTGLACLTTLATVALPGAAAADTLQLAASKDNTLYFAASGEYSNGAGDHLFAGNTGSAAARRAVIAFDLSDVPSGATVNSATLRLFMSKTRTGTQTIAAHRLLADWGEGTSDADGEEGSGAASTPGDATWVHAFYANQLWVNQGGHLAATPSAATAVTATGFYTWTGTGIAADVQAWVDNPSANFGWILVGNEATAQSAKRFDSRSNPLISQRPALVIEYTAPVYCLGDADCSGAVDFFDIDPFVAKLGCPSSDPDTCSDGCPWQNSDVDSNGTVDFFDIDPFVDLLGTACP